MSKQKSYDALYLPQYRKRNPEKQEKWRISSEIKHLEACGFEVKPTPQKKQPEDMTLDELENYIATVKNRRKEYQKKWKSANPEKRREYAARWRAKHREEIRAYSREYYALHPDKARESQAKWRAKNPNYEKIRWQRYITALNEARQKKQAEDMKEKGVKNDD